MRELNLRRWEEIAVQYWTMLRIIIHVGLSDARNQKGDSLLFFSFLGRPRGRNVLPSPNIEAILTCHSVVP